VCRERRWRSAGLCGVLLLALGSDLASGSVCDEVSLRSATL
jgi:hypothetical protein